MEEAGLRAKKWAKLAEFYPSPGFLAEKMTIYTATGSDRRAKRSRWRTSASRPSGSRPREIDEMIQSGKIIDAKTMIGFLRWKRYLGGK